MRKLQISEVQRLPQMRVLGSGGLEHAPRLCQSLLLEKAGKRAW